MNTEGLKADLEAARFAALANRARTAQAKQLVEHVFELVMQADGSGQSRGPYGKCGIRRKADTDSDGRGTAFR
jgi:hypothetical protein